MNKCKNLKAFYIIAILRDDGDEFEPVANCGPYPSVFSCDTPGVDISTDYVAEHDYGFCCANLEAIERAKQADHNTTYALYWFSQARRLHQVRVYQGSLES